MSKMSSLDSDSDEESSDWKRDLQKHRFKITQKVEYKKISSLLQSNMIMDREDDEEIQNNHINPTSTDKNNKMVDKLLKKSKTHYNKFVEVIGIYYPDLYKMMTGKEAPNFETPDVIPHIPPPDPGSRMDIIAILIEKLDLKKKECEDLNRKMNLRERDLEDRVKELQFLNTKLQEMQRRGERYDSMERDMEALKQVVDQVKNENYKVCMRLVDINEENSRQREHNMALRMENDKLKVEIRKMESTVNSERSVSFRLRKTIETGPSVKVIHALEQELDGYKLKLARVENDRKLNSNAQDIDTRLQILQGDKEEAIQMYAEASERLNNLREEFHSAETLRDKYLEETERLQLEVSALTDDCEMYKNRRDVVWQQLQEVEKERDQLMKERNEAQMTVQNHIDEKTKYRSQIRKLEEKHDFLSQKLREKENELLKLRKKHVMTFPPDSRDSGSTGTSSTATDHSSKTSKWECDRGRVYITKYYSEFLTKSEFGSSMNTLILNPKSENIFPEIPLAGNYGNECGRFTTTGRGGVKDIEMKGGRRSGGIRKKRNESKTAQAGSMSKHKSSETQSRTSSTDYQRIEDLNGSTATEVEAENLQKCVKLIGGNQSGIFINQVVENACCQSCPQALQPGMQILQICSSQKNPMKVEQWTLEYTNTILQNVQGPVNLSMEMKQKEYQNLKDTMKGSRITGDSFYVRANFKWEKHEMLNFNKYEVLHVISTQPSAELHWLACKVDPYNGNNASKCDVIPSRKYFLKNPLKQDPIVTKGRRFTEPNIFPSSNKPRDDIFHSSLKLPSPKQCCSQLVVGRSEMNYEISGQPYTVVRSVPSTKDKPRPCLILPQSLSKILSFKLTTIAEPLMFDFPMPESENCSVNRVRSRLYEKDVVSFNTISEEMQEIVTTSSVQKTSNMGKHCILGINENCISIQEYLHKLQGAEIYPIVIFLQTDRQKTVKLFVEEEKSKLNTVIQDMILIGEQLKRFACKFATVNLDRSNRVEDACQLILERVADETNRMVWQDDENDIYI